MKKKFIYFYLLLFFQILNGKPYPIQFSIPAQKIVKEIPQKTKDFAHIIPGKLSTYIFIDEQEYYKDYQRSYFAFTRKKGGWDCMRHYEILANGCIPYFLDLDKCPPNSMTFLPKELILEAMHIKGVNNGHIDHSIFDKEKYFELLQKLLDHTRTYLTCTSLATYLLNILNYSGKGKILLLANFSRPDYLVTCTTIGLKQLLGDKIIDIPKQDYIYTNYVGNTTLLYGKGFTYTKVVDDIPTDRSSIEQRIKNKEFELIIYAHTHYGRMLYSLVQEYYPVEKIAYLDGEDSHGNCPYIHLPNFFLREYE